MIAIVNYGLGNLGSIANMLKVIGERSVITSDRKEIESADKLILPGVGAFDAGVFQLNKNGLINTIKEQCLDKHKPILGICLGMQLLGRKSEEGVLPGLGLIPFDNIRFTIKDKNLKIPHMGWDIVKFTQDNPLIQGCDGTQRYYFVHSYHAKCDDENAVLMSCDYGYEFPAAVVNGNIYGVQFHPEKSHAFGMKLLENFARSC